MKSVKQNIGHSSTHLDIIEKNLTEGEGRDHRIKNG